MMKIRNLIVISSENPDSSNRPKPNTTLLPIHFHFSEIFFLLLLFRNCCRRKKGRKVTEARTKTETPGPGIEPIFPIL